MKPSIRLALVLACCSLSSASWAVGLGNIVVRSHLHQRLRAEIAVTTGSPGEAAAVTAELARSEELARAGSARAPSGVDLLVSVQHLADGRAVIVVETNRPVDEPSLSFMIAADAGRGRVLRQYSLTLDPGSGLADRAEVEAQPGAVPEAAPAPEALPGAAPARPVGAAKSTPSPAAPTPAAVKPAPAASVPPAAPPAPAKPPVADSAKPASPPAASTVPPAKPAPAEPAKPTASPAGSGTIARTPPEAAAPPKPAPSTPAVPAGPSNAELIAAAKRAQAEVEAKEREAAALREKVKQMEQGTPETRREIEAKNAEIERLRREIESTAKQAASAPAKPEPVAATPGPASTTPAPSPASTTQTPSPSSATPAPSATPPAPVSSPPAAVPETSPAETPAADAGGNSVPIWVWGAGGVLALVGAALLLFRRKKGPAMEWVMPEGSTASPSAAIMDAPREATVNDATASLDMTFDDLPAIAPVEPAPAAVETAAMRAPAPAPTPTAPAAKAPPPVPVGRAPSPLSLEQEVASAQARQPAASSRAQVEIKPLDADLASLAEALQEFEPHTPPARAPTAPAPLPAVPPPSKSNPFLRESPGLSLAEQPESHIVPMPGAFEPAHHEAYEESPIAKERHVVEFGDPFKKVKSEPEPEAVAETPSAALTRALGESVPERATTPQATLESELQAAADAMLDDDEMRAPAGGDAIATKLELARAYLDMDDDESAVHILEEVMHEGNAEQKQTATAMLAEARKR